MVAANAKKHDAFWVQQQQEKFKTKISFLFCQSFPQCRRPILTFFCSSYTLLKDKRSFMDNNMMTQLGR